MPVRFRCHHCRQLLGISRRKIGTEVACPTCHNPVTVPAADAADADELTAPKPLSPFEGNDLNALLQPAAAEADATPTGTVPSSIQATWLTVGLVLLLALFFAAGLLIGRYWF